MKKLNTIKIGKKLQAIRKIYGYTQEALAEKVECSTRYIGDVEQDRSKPSYEILVRICNTFNIGMDEIFSSYLHIKNDEDVDIVKCGFEKLKKNNRDTIVHLIEYFNKKT